MDSNFDSGPGLELEEKPRQTLKMKWWEEPVNFRIRSRIMGRSRIAAIPRRKKIRINLAKERKIASIYK